MIIHNRQRVPLTAIRSLLLVFLVASLCSCKKLDPIAAYNRESYKVTHELRLCNEKYANSIEYIDTVKLGQWARESQPFEARMRAIVPPKGWENYHRVFIEMMRNQSLGLNEAYGYAKRNEYGKRDAALIKMGDEMARNEQRLVDETKKLGYRVDALQAHTDKSKAYWQGVKKGLRPE